MANQSTHYPLVWYILKLYTPSQKRPWTEGNKIYHGRMHRQVTSSVGGMRESFEIYLYRKEGSKTANITIPVSWHQIKALDRDENCRQTRDRWMR